MAMTDRESSGERIQDTLLKAGLGDAAPDVMEQLDRFMGEVAAWSERVHLVGRGRMRSSLSLLLLDSLLLLQAAQQKGLLRHAEPSESVERSASALAPHGKTAAEAPKCRVADIGSGAGFPGIAWKIVRGDLDVTLFERKMKPQLFLERIIVRLSIAGVRVIGEDAAHFVESNAFDLVTSKASGKLGAILPLAERLLAPGGAYMTIKGRAWREEIPVHPRGSIRLDSAIDLPEKRGAALIFRRI